VNSSSAWHGRHGVDWGQVTLLMAVAIPCCLDQNMQYAHGDCLFVSPPTKPY
jgi:hypothetical protein